MRLKLFSVPKPKRFEYTPVFYDETKERAKERERRVREELGLPPMEGDENRTVEDRIRGSFSSGRISTDIRFNRKIHRRSSNLRILVIIAVLILLCYLLLGEDGVGGLFNL